MNAKMKAEVAALTPRIRCQLKTLLIRGEWSYDQLYRVCFPEGLRTVFPAAYAFDVVYDEIYKAQNFGDYSGWRDNPHKFTVL